MTSITKPRVMYLDVDDTLLVWTNSVPGFAAPMADKFLEWALEHFEVRWLTMWCPSGRLSQDGAEELSYRFNSTVHPDVFRNIVNPKSFINRKTEAIDFDDSRPWVWVEDTNILWTEKNEMRNRNVIDNYYPTNVTTNAVMIQSTWRKLAKRFGLPGTPPMPFTTKSTVPVTPLTMEQLLDRFRGGKMQNHDDSRTPPLVLPQGWNW